MGVKCQVFGSVRTLKHHGVLDLLNQLLQEVLPGGVIIQEAAGKCGPLVVFEPAQRRNEDVCKYVDRTLILPPQ